VQTSRTRAAAAAAPPEGRPRVGPANEPSSAHAATVPEIADRTKSSGGVAERAGWGGGGERWDARGTVSEIAERPESAGISGGVDDANAGGRGGGERSERTRAATAAAPPDAAIGPCSAHAATFSGDRPESAGSSGGVDDANPEARPESRPESRPDANAGGGRLDASCGGGERSGGGGGGERLYARGL